MPSSTNAAGVAIARRRDLIAALPRPAVLSDGSALVRRVEVSRLPAPLLPSGPVQFSSARADDHGRVVEARLFASLGWSPGVGLSARPDGTGRVLLAPANGAGGVVTIDRQKRLCLTPALRDLLGVTAGASVLIVPTADPGNALLVGGSALLSALGGTHVAA